ncbi:hypothetical protein ABK040_003007 [Willaertia magna]
MHGSSNNSNNNSGTTNNSKQPYIHHFKIPKKKPTNLEFKIVEASDIRKNMYNKSQQQFNNNNSTIQESNHSKYENNSIVATTSIHNNNNINQSSIHSSNHNINENTNTIHSPFTFTNFEGSNSVITSSGPTSGTIPIQRPTTKKSNPSISFNNNLSKITKKQQAMNTGRRKSVVTESSVPGTGEGFIPLNINLRNARRSSIPCGDLQQTITQFNELRGTNNNNNLIHNYNGNHNNRMYSPTTNNNTNAPMLVVEPMRDDQFYSNSNPNGYFTKGFSFGETSISSSDESSPNKEDQGALYGTAYYQTLSQDQQRYLAYGNRHTLNTLPSISELTYSHHHQQRKNSIDELSFNFSNITVANNNNSSSNHMEEQHSTIPKRRVSYAFESYDSSYDEECLKSFSSFHFPYNPSPGNNPTTPNNTQSMQHHLPMINHNQNNNNGFVNSNPQIQQQQPMLPSIRQIIE